MRGPNGGSWRSGEAVPGGTSSGTVTSELRLGGRHHHVKVRDDDPSVQVTTDAVFTEFFDPDVFVARQTISGDPGIDPATPLELRVEFVKTGRERHPHGHHPDLE